MNLVIDAHIFKAWFQETSLHQMTHTAQSAVPIFDQLGDRDIAYFDKGGQILHEWTSVVCPELTEALVAKMLHEDKIRPIGPCRDASLESKLRNAGFPRSKDRCYVRTARAVVCASPKATLVSEDMHYYEPKLAKAGRKTRLAHLRRSKGTVAQLLKKHDILVCSTINFS